ncbi:hypothetical protein OG241_35880 [Streptomyces sp. NBC_01390]|uniref:hypothetical protein n=1 Tax=Streptomyces sp. NBC_01390 TaxID=2903850 RepID=UPI00324FD940
MHDVVLPGQQAANFCPICNVQFQGVYTGLARRRWTKAKEQGAAAVTQLLLEGKESVPHNPPECLGRFLPACVLAKESSRESAERQAMDVWRTYFEDSPEQRPQ